MFDDLYALYLSLVMLFVPTAELVTHPQVHHLLWWPALLTCALMLQSGASQMNLEGYSLPPTQLPYVIPTEATSRNIPGESRAALPSRPGHPNGAATPAYRSQQVCPAVQIIIIIYCQACRAFTPPAERCLADTFGTSRLHRYCVQWCEVWRGHLKE